MVAGAAIKGHGVEENLLKKKKRLGKPLGCQALSEQGKTENKF